MYRAGPSTAIGAAKFFLLSCVRASNDPGAKRLGTVTVLHITFFVGPCHLS